MNTQNLAAASAALHGADVALPQGAALDQFACQSGYLSAIVNLGRTQAVLTSHKKAAQSTPSQNKWSRGCRALKSPYLHFAWSAFSLHVPRKQKKSFMLTSRPFRSSLHTPASTSNLSGRVSAGSQPRPALFSNRARIGRIPVPFNMEGAAC